MKIQIACLIIAGLAVTGMTGMRGQTQNHRLVAHEWGTFTSVQGADGVLLDWKPLETSKLPKFVYDWTHPGLNRVFTGGGYGGFGKGSMIARQRMETPVIYFYSDKERTADVRVQFPLGRLTEWYPQATRVGPYVTTNKEEAPLAGRSFLECVTPVIAWAHANQKAVRAARTAYVPPPANVAL